MTMGVNRRVAEGALKKFGADVKFAESGKAVLEMLQLPQNFDACFMDIQMPEMDGFQATCQIRMMKSKANEEMKNGSEWHVPILAMTADVIHATYDECLKRGMDGYVSSHLRKRICIRKLQSFPNQRPSQTHHNLLLTRQPTRTLETTHSISQSV
ncbi:histidine kinase 4-like [Phaseolus vulgaris]|uniref:histidine kinase 4-like n=1 Tax=Phaseolus vulgaris TaxID=3885 RepID=UPI0035C98607